MNFNQEINIGSSRVGSGCPVYIVAEIGINHNGDINLAEEMVRSAKKAGVNAVKFQNYLAEDFISDKSLTYEYFSWGKKIVESQYEMFKRCELSQEQLVSLSNYCSKIEVDFHSTPTNEEGIKLLSELGVSVIKNGSDYLTHLPLIRKMGKTGLPTVLSTGMAMISEIDQAVQAFSETGNRNLILLHCTSSYPTPVQEINLSRLATLSSAFGVPVGFSDHTAGNTAAIGATILGACWIEKHFTLDRNLPGPDHWFSMDPEELKSLVKAVREAEKIVGSASIHPTESEKLGRRDFRLSCVAKHNLEKGIILNELNIDFKRPGHGIPPSDIKSIIGRKTKQPIVGGSLLKHKMLE